MPRKQKTREQRWGICLPANADHRFGASVSNAAHRPAQIVSRAHRLPTRPADGRQDGRPCGPTLDSSSLRADEALGISLRTPGLLLREWHDTDREPFAAMCADPAVMEMLLPFPDRAANAWIARMQAHFDKHRLCQWAVEIPGETSLIGRRSDPRSRWAGGSHVPIGARAMPLKRHRLSSMTVSDGSAWTRSSPTPFPPIGVSWA